MNIRERLEALEAAMKAAKAALWAEEQAAQKVAEDAWGVRVGVKDAAGTVHWTAADNCEVLFSDNDLGLKNLEVQP